MYDFSYRIFAMWRKESLEQALFAQKHLCCATVLTEEFSAEIIKQLTYPKNPLFALLVVITLLQLVKFKNVYSIMFSSSILSLSIYRLNYIYVIYFPANTDLKLERETVSCRRGGDRKDSEPGKDNEYIARVIYTYIFFFQAKWHALEAQ